MDEQGNGALPDAGPFEMHERPTDRPRPGLSLVTGPARTPLTRTQADALGRVLGTVRVKRRA